MVEHGKNLIFKVLFWICEFEAIQKPVESLVSLIYVFGFYFFFLKIVFRFCDFVAILVVGKFLSSFDLLHIASFFSKIVF